VLVHASTPRALYKMFPKSIEPHDVLFIRRALRQAPLQRARPRQTERRRSA
jgi:hypothetical protein